MYTYCSYGGWNALTVPGLSLPVILASRMSQWRVRITGKVYILLFLSKALCYAQMCSYATCTICCLKLGVRICNVCLARMHTLLLVGVAHAFGTVGHVQQSVGSVKDGKEYMYEWVWGSERGSNTSLKWSFLETAILCFASRCSLVLSISLQTSRGSGCILALCFCFRFHVSLLTLITANFDVVTMRPLAPLQQRTIHLCTQPFVNRIF